MVSPKFFVDCLSDAKIDFFAGVPDSLLKNLCAFLADNFDERHNIIAANEGGAIALAAGHYLATGKIGAVYMQNSGEGNALNPLLSLTDKEVFNIPLLLLVGWRGKPGVHDEPQHVKQGKVTTELLDVAGIKNEVMSKEDAALAEQVKRGAKFMSETGEAFALVIEKDTFAKYTPQAKEGSALLQNEPTMGREEAIKTATSFLGERDCVVSTTGMISRELFEYRTAMSQSHASDFLTVGSMGHASQIALAVALEKSSRRVWCFDGDGALIMHAGSLFITGSMHPKNFVHIVFNNGAHDSVGGQPTVGLKIDLPAIARAAGYDEVHSACSTDELRRILAGVKSRCASGAVFIEVKVRKGNRADLGRPTTTPAENKRAFMEFLR